jgi:hypothetical protein
LLVANTNFIKKELICNKCNQFKVLFLGFKLQKKLKKEGRLQKL